MDRRRFVRSVLALGATGGLVSLPERSVYATDRPHRIHWSSSHPNDLRVNPLFEACRDNVHFDLRSYAIMRYGPTAREVLVSNHAYGWRIRYRSGSRTRGVGINMLSVASWTGRRMFGTRLKNYGCYFVNWNAYAWRGVYIFRI